MDLYFAKLYSHYKFLLVLHDTTHGCVPTFLSTKAALYWDDSSKYPLNYYSV